CSVGTVLCQLGTHRRGAHTLEQSLVAFRNALAERSRDEHSHAWAVTQNNVAVAMQALGEHEEDIASLEASIPLYDAVLSVLTRDSLPMLWAMVSANRASAKLALDRKSTRLNSSHVK